MSKPKHRPVGAYLPVGQLDGDCACGRGAYPCPDTDRSAGRWCDHCQQYGSHHTDRHAEFFRFFDDDGRHLGYCNECGEEAELGQECCETGEVVQYEDDEADF